MRTRRSVSRRRFVQLGTMATAAMVSPSLLARSAARSSIPIPDDGWRLWPDSAASWENDEIFLPDEVDLSQLSQHPPTGGWAALNSRQGIPVTLPASAEQYYWGRFGPRAYTANEYEYADGDPEVINGAYRGVSWYWRNFEMPSAAKGKQVTLEIRSYRQRLEVYVNQKLAGYDLIAETSYDCDITPMLRTGSNQFALRITNPGGVYDWRDYNTLRWGKREFHSGRGFGGLDRSIALHLHDKIFLNDLWVLNTPDVTAVQAWASVRNSLARAAKVRIRFSVLERDTETVAASALVETEVPAGASIDVEGLLNYPDAKLWSPESPSLYLLRAELVSKGANETSHDLRERAFGFRWFEPVGIGSNAMLMLNGKRIRLVSAIDFGTWGFNGLWPTPELAAKAVQAAKGLGLNALQFHRNLGKHEELETDDERGLLRYMEPGGGVLSFEDDGLAYANNPAMPTPPPIDTSGSGGEPKRWSQRYMEFRVLRMMRDHRSHPALVIYNLQNERNPDLHNPRIFHMLRAMRKADPSRTILLHSGIWVDNQAFFLPYSDVMRTENGTGHSGWADKHTVGGAGVWTDSLYSASRSFTQYSGNRREISMQGEMLGWAAPDNHAQVLESIRRGGGHSYDRADHERILAAYELFFDKWNFRTAFPTTSALFADAGNKLYDTWGRILQIIRTDDASDFLVINGWAGQPIDSHSGLLDNQRNFKGDPQLIRSALEPLRPVVQPHGVVHKPQDSIVVDLFLLNETHRSVSGTLRLSVTDPAGKTTTFGHFPAPEFVRSQFAYYIAERVSIPSLTDEGYYTLRFALEGSERAEGSTRIFLVDPAPRRGAALHAGVLGDAATLAALTPHGAMNAVQFRPEDKYDLAIWLSDGMEAAAPLLKRVRDGLPILVLAQNSDGVEAAARSLAGAGAFTYAGLAGESRGCWMGTWVFVKDHPAFAGLPSNQVMKWEYQVDFKDASGVMVDGPGVDVFAGFGRDHDARLGAATFHARLGKGRILFQAVRGMQPLVYERFIINAARFLLSPD
jgi:beta-galactosidase